MFQKQGTDSYDYHPEEESSLCPHSRSLEYLKHSLATSKTSYGITNSSISVVNPICLNQAVNQITILQRKKEWIQTELQQVTSILQQCEQYQRNIYQIVTCEEVVCIIKEISSRIVDLMEKIKLIESSKDQIDRFTDRIKQIQKEIQKHNEKIDRHNKKLMMHLHQTKSLHALISYCQKHNIRQVAFQYINQYLSRVVGQYRESKKREKFLLNQSYLQFKYFLQQYKSENIEKKIQQLWHLLDQEIWIQIMDFQQFFEGDTNTTSFTDGIEEIRKQIMNKKIDIQIIQNEIEVLQLQIGLNLGFHSKGSFSIQDMVNKIIYEIISPQLLTFNLKYSSQPNQNCLQLLQKSFTKYFENISQSYYCQNQIFSQTHCTEDLWSFAKQNLKKALLNGVRNIERNKNLKKAIRQLQSQLKSLQKEIVQQRLKAEIQKQDQKPVKSPQVLSLFSSGQAGSLVSFSGAKDKRHFEIKNRVNLHTLSFKVIKTLHISVNINKNIRANYEERENSKALTNRSNQGERRRKNISEQIQPQESRYCQVRSLQFCKNKLIMRRQNILTHEEIQIKRIKAIKVMGINLINVYFAKGFMSLQFLKDDRQNDQRINWGRKCKSLGKYWVKCFKAIYYEQLDQIRISEQEESVKLQYHQGYSEQDKGQREEQQLKRSKLIGDERIEDHGSFANINKENMQKNCDWFLKKSVFPTDRTRQQTFRPRNQQRQIENYY